ncbi:MAG: hypothetical protein GY884_23320, partial [Proteobacteria bacterium]|nr:hypothetical protein [Pseudomonadota bacterium]
LEFTDPPTDLDVSVPGASGTLIQSDDEDTFYWVPDAPLAPDTTYSVEISWCGGFRGGTISFTTSELGDPLTTNVEGRVYRVDLTSGRVRIPVGVGSILKSYMEDSATLLEVADIDGSDLELRAAPIDDDTDEQDMCASVADMPTADFSDSPYFQAGPTDVVMDIAGMSIEMHNQILAGTFAPDGSYIGGMRFSGEIDTRGMADLVGGKGPETICDLVAGFGVSCITCSSDGQPYCMETEIVDVEAERENGSLVETSRYGTCDDPDDWNASSTCATGAVGSLWLLPLLGLGRRRS